MLRNSGGKKDVALTMMIATWILCCSLAIIGAVKEVKVGEKEIEFNDFNMGFATVVFTPIVGLYFGRRYTDANKGVYDTQVLYAKSNKEVLSEDVG